MSKKMKYLLGILATWIIGGWLYTIFCCAKCQDGNCNHGNAKDTTSVADKDTLSAKLPGFSVANPNFNYETNQNFKFLNGNFKTILPLSDSINIGIDKLKNYLSSGKENLKITGYALSSEKNTSIYENLGLARAADLKNLLVSKGISADRIDTFGEIKESISASGDTLVGPAFFELLEVSKAQAPKVDYAALKEKINANPLIMYFKTGEASINLSDEDRKKVADMLNYLENVPGSKLSVTGHTDNVGKRDTNIKLGLGRATFATDYLVSNGISKDKIDTSSKGPDQPMADNSTAEGRNKNRRTVVTIK
jgi:OmpA-OmpF porin, OOP family